MHQALKDWTQGPLARSLERFPERRESFPGPDGEELPRLALPAKIDQDYLDRLGFPGQYPFTRGVQPTMYRGRLWTMRQYAGFSTAEDSNRRFRYLLDQGQTGLSIAFDLPTQMGYDSDAPESLGEVGRVGVAVDSLADMELLFAGIPLERISTSMTINAPAMILLAMYVAVGQAQGVAPERLRGTIQNDILKEYTARGAYIFPPGPSLGLVTDIFAWCAANTPLFNTISISGYHIREAGATAVQEVAFTLADARTYVEAALEAGLDLEAFARRLSFFFSATTNLLEEVAKFRAARRLWARIMGETFGTRSPAARMLRFHTQTAGSTLTAGQIDNNIVRVTIQALAAVLGGTQSLHTNSRDEALGLPDEASVRIALRTQQIIAHESGVADSVDPLGGSFLVEELTDRIEAGAQALMDEIEERGGVVACIEDGFIQSCIEDAAYQAQQELEEGTRVHVGVNRFTVEEEPPRPPPALDAAMEEAQKRRLAQVRASRDQARVDRALAALEEAAREGRPQMDLVLEAVRRYATVGEICAVWRRVFGQYGEMRP